jgi:hypothetical protein
VEQNDVDVAELAAKYRAALLEMDKQRIETGGRPRSWNRLVNRMQALHLRLRETAAGRDAITALIDDENPTVRSWSAVNSLAWAADTARPVLVAQANEQGLLGFEAQIALREFDAGRLDTGWQPKGP